MEYFGTIQESALTRWFHITFRCTKANVNDGMENVLE